PVLPPRKRLQDLGDRVAPVAFIPSVKVLLTIADSGHPGQKALHARLSSLPQLSVRILQQHTERAQSRIGLDRAALRWPFTHEPSEHAPVDVDPPRRQGQRARAAPAEGKTQ